VCQLVWCGYGRVWEPDVCASLRGCICRAHNCHQNMTKHVTPWTVPPRKWSPRTVHGRIIGPPGPNIAAIPGPPLLPTVPPAADCGLFAIAFATALAYGEQPGHCPFNQNKVRQHQLKSLQDGEMTPLPLKKNRHNGRRVKTWNTIQICCTCRMLTVWERVSCMTGLLFASERLQYMLPRFIV